VGTRIYLHLTWTTLERAPLITEPARVFLGRFLRQEAGRHGVCPLAVGMVKDHVHMILELPPVFDLPRLTQGLKGGSARLANRDGHSGERTLRWAQGYDARTVGVGQLASAVRYVEEQALRHPERAIVGT
jgi:putative transposase